jgi:DNA-binding NarL/FixJ family response regulator
MHTILVVDPEPYFAEELQQRFRNKVILHAEDPHIALELLEKNKISLHLVLVRHSLRKSCPDGIMLVRILSLREECRHTRFAMVFDTPHDSRDARAAYAAGASRTLCYPREVEFVSYLALQLIRLLYLPTTPRWGPWFSTA